MLDAADDLRHSAEKRVTDRTNRLRGSPGIGKPAQRVRGYLAFVGPAVIVSIAYMDPGNFATNIQAGAKYGYGLLWVVLLANLIAMLFQALSAKLGIVTGRNLAEMCCEQFPQPIVWAMWVISEVAAMATDLAEFLGGAIGLSLLFQMPLLAGMVVTAVVTYGILTFESSGFRPIELVIGSLVGIIGRRCGDRNGLSHVDALARHRGSRCVPGLPFCIGNFELGGWNNRRPNDHARIHQVPDTDPGSATGNDGTGCHCRRSWRKCD